MMAVAALSTLGFNEAAAIRCGSHIVSEGAEVLRGASMRPQRFAADHQVTPTTHVGKTLASMRPQRFAADHLPMPDVVEQFDFASMRPQRFAADHSVDDITGGSRLCRFNEAAAIRCGSRGILAEEAGGKAASMRPQRFAADHDCPAPAPLPCQMGFNEAAAIRCGSPDRQGTGRNQSLGFNEAAAIRCGSLQMGKTAHVFSTLALQ